MQGIHMVAHGGEHAAYLVVASFDNCHPRAARTHDVKGGRLKGKTLGLEHHRATGEYLALVSSKVARQRGFVYLGEMGARRRDTVE